MMPSCPRLSPFKSLLLVATLLCGFSSVTNSFAQQPGRETRVQTFANVIVTPYFAGQIVGYDVDPTGSEGVLSEVVNLPNGNVLAATETFYQPSGQIVSVVAKTETQDVFVTQGVLGKVGLVRYQHNGQRSYLTMSPVGNNKFTGKWTPPIKPNYQLGAISANQGSPAVATYQFSSVTGLSYVFRSNIAENTFGPQISLKDFITGNEFLHPLIALDNQAHYAVLADSPGCSVPACDSALMVVDLLYGAIAEYSDLLGLGAVNGLAIDPETSIACTTTSLDQGVEFYNYLSGIGFEVTIPNAGSTTQAGLDVEFDAIHKLFLIAQYSSTGTLTDPEPRIYVYDEAGNLQETITGLQRIPMNPSRIALNPKARAGFVPVVVEFSNQQPLQLQSFQY